MTDDCTLWPDRIGAWEYAACCRAHDLAYSDPEVPRLVADLDLARCVFDATGNAWLAVLMLTGVVSCGWAFRRMKRVR